MFAKNIEESDLQAHYKIVENSEWEQDFLISLEDKMINGKEQNHILYELDKLLDEKNK